jgi:hypothetical protein
MLQRKTLVSIVVLSLVSGCDSSAGSFFDQLSQGWNALQIVLHGGHSPLAKHPEPAASTRKLTPSEAAAKAKENSELLQEMLRVVFNRDVQDRAMFGTLLDTLNQGASLEGIYNGLTHSADYRKLEVSNPGSHSDALIFFAGELAHTEALLRTPNDFAQSAAQPLALAVQPEDTGTNEITFGASPSPSPSAQPSSAATADPQVVDGLERKYMATFADSSIFTLKRLLGDEILRLVDEKRKDPKQLQAWYGQWVVRMAGKGVDFGIPLRNQADLAFHTQWAATADPDRLKWEVLNRIHRVLNFKNATRTPLPSTLPSGGST